MKHLSITCLILLSVFFTAKGQEPLLEYMQEEVNRNFTELQKQNDKPYYISYRVNDTYSASISSSFGAITGENAKNTRQLTIDVRVGDYGLDNSHELRDNRGSSYFQSNKIFIPTENNEKAIKQALWFNTDEEYKTAVDRYNKVKANVAVKVENEDKSDDFSLEEVEQYYDKPFDDEITDFDFKKWTPIIKELSKQFLKEPAIVYCRSNINFKAIRKYFVSTEGAVLAHNVTFCRVYVSARVKAEDGMVMPLYRSFFAYLPEDLPSKEEMLKEVDEMIQILTNLKNAPIVEPYQGPAILSSKASGVFFHEIFGHRVEGQRMKSEYSGQTFKKKIGEKVLPDEFVVYFDPTILKYGDKDLYGSYKFDDQGIRGKKVSIVDNGILKGFLMSRCPIKGALKSNGHGRAESGKAVTSRQSNLIVESTKDYSEEDIKNMLIEKLKNENLEFGFYFSEVTGGFTTTGRFMPNSFNVTPTVVYKVFVDGSPDELVRGVDLVGTPLAMFSEISAAGGNSDIFTGTCGAESGGIPVTGISPTLFVKKIEMQKKYKSQTKPAILKRPDVK
jgi:TldD protein